MDGSSYKGFVLCESRGFLSTQCHCSYAVTPAVMSGCRKSYRADKCHKWRDLRCREYWERFEVTTTTYLRIRFCQTRRSVCGLVLHLWKDGSTVMFTIKGSKKNKSNPVAKGSHPITISHRRKVTSHKNWILIVNFISDLVFLSAFTDTHLMPSLDTYVATKMNGAALYTFPLSQPQNTVLNLSFLVYLLWRNLVHV